MSNYIFAYHGGKMPESPEEGTKHMAKFKAWVAALAMPWSTPGTPLGMTKTVSSGGISVSVGSEQPFH